VHEFGESSRVFSLAPFSSLRTYSPFIVASGRHRVVVLSGVGLISFAWPNRKMAIEDDSGH